MKRMNLPYGLFIVSPHYFANMIEGLLCFVRVLLWFLPSRIQNPARISTAGLIVHLNISMARQIFGVIGYIADG